MIKGHPSLFLYIKQRTAPVFTVLFSRHPVGKADSCVLGPQTDPFLISRRFPADPEPLRLGGIIPGLYLKAASVYDGRLRGSRPVSPKV